MPDTLDQVAFDVGANLAPLAEAYAKAEVMTDKLAGDIKTKMGAAWADSFKAAPMQVPFNSNALANIATGKQAIKEVTAETEKMHGSVAQAVIEFRAVFDELSSGRTRQTPGTLAIIATRVFGISGATLAWGAALAAIPIGMVVAAGIVISQLDNIQRKLVATGMAAGVTRDQLIGMATAIDKSGNGQSFSGALGGLGILAGRGNIGSAQLPSAETAASGFAEATGQKLAKAAEAFEQDLAAPSKGARDLNDQMKLLTAAQVREIDDLMETGERQKAQQVIIDAMNDRTRNATSQLSSFAQMLGGAGRAVSDFIHWLGQRVSGSFSDTEMLAQLESGRRVARPGSPLTPFDQLSNQTIDKTEAPIRARIAAANQGAASAEQANQLDQQINAARELDSRWDVAGKKLREHTEDVSALTKGLAAATTRYAQLTALAASQPGKVSAAELQAARENIGDVQTMLANAQNPKYNPNSGVPKGRKTPPIGENPYYRDAQTAAEQLRIAQQVEATDERDRKTVEAKLKAELEYQKNLLNPKAAPYAAQIRDTAVAMAGFQETARRRDTLLNMQAEANQQEALAAAHEKGTEAVIAQTTAGRAHLAWLKGEIDDESAYAAALRQTAQAAAQIATAQRIVSMAQQNEDLGRLVGARGDPAALAAAQRQNEALSATRDERASARANPGQPSLADVHTLEALFNGMQRDQADAQIATDKQNNSIADQISLLNQEAALKHADAEDRAKELADLQAALDLKREGWTVDMQGYQEALAQRAKLNEALAQSNLQNQGLTKAAQMSETLRNGLEGLAMTGVTNFKNLGKAASDFATQIGELVLKMFVLEPLLNFLGGTGNFGSGGLLGKIFGGGKAAGGYVDPSKFYVVGEEGPEILGPGASGMISPIKAPPAGIGNSQTPAPVTINHNMAVSVSGTGDKDLLDKVHAAATEATATSLKAYDAASNRTARARLIQSGKRALV